MEKKVTLFELSAIILTVTLLVISAVQGNLGQPSAINSETSGKLNLIFVSTESIEGEYYGTNGLAIHFISDEERISITTFTYNTTSDSRGLEEPILLLERLPVLGNARLMNILGAKVLYFNTTVDEQSKIVDYFVPARYTARVESAIRSHKRNRLHKMIRKLRRDRVAIERTAEEKLRHPAVLLLQEAAFAMGKSGIEGRENPAALQLYVTAMRMLEWREKKLKEEGSGELLEEDNVLEAFPRQKRSHCGGCTTGYCPDRYHDDRCVGMCGLGCSCWRRVCGDCCWQQGCYEHDLCCGACPRISPACLSISGFRSWCSVGFSRYPRCLNDCWR